MMSLFRWFAAVAFAIAAALGSSQVAGAAQDLEHPLTPSTQRLSGNLLRGNGLPNASEDASATTSGPSHGRDLYGVHCSSCHGAQLQGTADGPSLRAAGGASVDFYVRTGRMPAAVNNGQAWHVNPHFNAVQSQALIDYVTAQADRRIAIPDVKPDPRLLQRGRLLFEDNCEACHGAAAQGATAGFGWIAVPLFAATNRQIGEAIRIGPGVMPVFTPALLSDRDVDAIATYVAYIRDTPPNPGGTPFDYLGPTAEGAITLAIGIGGLFLVIYFTGTTTQGPRFNRRH